MRNELAEILFEEAPDGILVATTEGRYVDANPAALRLLGYSREELLTLSIRDVILPGDVGRMEQGRQVRLSGISGRNEYTLVRKDGALIPTEIMSRALSDGRLVGYVRDISDRVFLQEALDAERSRLTETLEAADVGVWEWDVATGKVVSNALLRRFFGLTDDEGAEKTAQEWMERIHPDDMAPVETALRRSMTTGDKYEVTYRVLLPAADGGAVRWLYSRGRTTQNADGTPLRLHGAATDITARMAAQEALRERSQFIETINEVMPMLLYVYDMKENRNVFMNRLVTELVGYTPEQTAAFGPDLLSRLIHPDDMADVQRHHARIAQAKDGEILSIDYRMRHANGEWRWFTGREMVFRRDPDGSVRQFIGTSEDVTERWNAEEARRRADERFRAAQESSVDGFMTLDSVRDADGKIIDFTWTYVNEAASKTTGWPREWFLGKRLLEEMPGNREEGLFDAYVQVVETGEPYTRQLHYVHEDTDVYIRLMAVKLGDGFGVSFADLSERERAQAAMRHSEARYRALTEATTAVVWVIDPAGEISQRMDSWSEFTGQTEEEYRGWGWLDAIHPDDREGVAEICKEALATASFYECSYRLRYSDGSYRYTVARAVPLRDDAGNIIEWAGANEDVHDQLTAEMALRESEERFRMLADNIAQFAWMGDGDGYLFWYNRRWFDYTGTTLNDMKGWGWQAVHHPDHIDRVTAKFAAHIRAKIPWEDTFPLRGADGEYRWFLSRAFPFRNAAGEVVRWFGTNTDITEQREAEQELRRHQAEMETLNARLKRAMQETHHRVKNNLQVISALVEMQTGETAETPAALRRINQHVQALAVIHDLLTQQAKGDADLSRIGSKAVLERLLGVMRTTIGDREIAAEVEDFPLTPQQASALALLVSECISNALKHSGGDIEISLRRDKRNRENARLEVCDDGPGFPPDFDPDRAANTGLQLIENAARWDLRGDIHYDNHPGGGGRVAVIFPCQQEEAFEGGRV